MLGQYGIFGGYSPYLALMGASLGIGIVFCGGWCENAGRRTLVKTFRLLLPLLMIAGLPGLVRAQATPPFYSPGSTAFNPQISVVNSGILLNAQAVVSADRKYVTLNMQPVQTQLMALIPFNINAQTNLGFVGGVRPTVGTTATGSGAGPTHRPGQPPVRMAAPPVSAASVLERPGMTLLVPAPK